MTPGEIAIALLGSGTLGAIILQVATTIGKRITGTAGRERVRNTTIESQRVRAIEERDRAYEERDETIAKIRKESEDTVRTVRAERDRADVERRKANEYASWLRGELLRNGITPGEWPDFERTRNP